MVETVDKGLLDKDHDGIWWSCMPRQTTMCLFLGRIKMWWEQHFPTHKWFMCIVYFSEHEGANR